MVLRINPALKRLWRDPNTIQFGYQPGFIIKNATPEQERIIALLETGIAENQVEEIDKLAESEKSVADDFLRRLAPVLTTGGKYALDAEAIERQFAEIIRISLQGNSHPADVLSSRQQLRIFISELSRAGLVLAQALASGSVGKIFSSDSKRVTVADTDLLGHPQHAVGTSRHTSAKELLAQRSKITLNSRTTDEIYNLADFAVVIANEVLNPDKYQIWLTREIPHLAIVFSERGVSVSPVVIPGKTPCLGCAEIERITVDPSWVAIAPQLEVSPRNLADTNSLLFAASVAAKSILQHCDAKYGHRTQDKSVGYEMNSNTGKIQALSYANLNCGCRL